MSETHMEWDEVRCRADPSGAAAEIRRLTEASVVRMHPQAVADLERIAETDPEGAKEIGEALSAMREAAQAWRAGQFDSFEDAVEALTGQRPQPVFDEDEENSDLDFAVGQPHYTIRRNDQSHAEAIERDGHTVLLLATGAERNEQEVEDVVARLNGRG